MSDSIAARLNELGYTLPPAPLPAANYVPVVRVGDLLYVSGQISRGADGVDIAGKLGADLSIAEGQQAAEICALNILSQVKAAVGSLDHVMRIVKVNGFVNSTADFVDHPQVVNGASNLFGTLFKEYGKHARCALGVNSLPFGVAVEMDAIIQVK
jgi:enamine deaminase RidA (YjgF/YER057c/UK114 family)